MDYKMTIAGLERHLPLCRITDDLYIAGFVMFDDGFGQMFKDWAYSDFLYVQKSYGNGAAMRVTAIAYAFDNLKDVLREVEDSCYYTHKNKEAITGAKAVATAIFMARNNATKNEIKQYIEKVYHYELIPLDDIREDYTFDSRASYTVPPAIEAFIESDSYEDAIRNAISIGGDSDTIACMTGGIAEAYYKEIPQPIIDKARLKMDAGLKRVCNCMSFPELPLKGNIADAKFKVYMTDTGLLVASLDDEAQIDLRANKNLGVYKGALYENFTAESLIKQGYGLYYYSKENSTLEEDFFIRSANELIPVEVKANTNRSKSLRTLISSDSYSDIKHGIKFTIGNVGISDDIVTFPYFCSFLLKRYMERQNFFQ